jgi:hypothetical protein
MIQSLLIATINIIIYVLAFHLTGIDLGDVVVERVPSVDRLPVLAFEASTLSRIDPLCVATHNRPLGSPFNRSWFPASVADPGQAFLGWADDNIGDPLCGEGYGPVPDFLVPLLPFPHSRQKILNRQICVLRKFVQGYTHGTYQAGDRAQIWRIARAQKA